MFLISWTTSIIRWYLHRVICSPRSNTSGDVDEFLKYFTLIVHIAVLIWFMTQNINLMKHVLFPYVVHSVDLTILPFIYTFFPPRISNVHLKSSSSKRAYKTQTKCTYSHHHHQRNAIYTLLHLNMSERIWTCKRRDWWDVVNVSVAICLWKYIHRRHLISMTWILLNWV